MNNDPTRDELANKAKFELVWAELRHLEIPEIIVTFSGEGDSGQIDDVSVSGIVALPGAEARYALLNEAFHGTFVTVHPDEAPVRLHTLIEELTDPLISDQGVNWWDNDGGFGECRWDASAEPPLISVSISERVVHTVEHGFEFNRFGLEEVN